ncbi:hypothetical protein [Streptomyces enissocaesilis]|uniref:Lipoprotein n=1 Tax=Streptomyces enissocaesilis TaxID=332589 RepID=A0ABN3X8R1_9ACTN
MREHVRTTVAAAAVAAVLVLTGCSGDSGGTDGGKSEEKGGGSGQSSTPSGGAKGAGASADVTGSWIATTDGKVVALIVQGSDAAVAGEHVCSGKVNKEDTVTLDLRCGDGNTDRTAGLVTPGADGGTLTVKWDSGLKDSFRKSAGGALPEGIPTDVPKLPGS